MRNGLAKVTISCSDWQQAVVTPLAIELPVVVLPKRHAAEANGLKSIDSKVETSIKFVNRSGQTIKVYWLDYDGNRKLYKTLLARQLYDQETFLTHPWLITDENDKAWHIYFADAQPRTVEILEPEKK